MKTKYNKTLKDRKEYSQLDHNFMSTKVPNKTFYAKKNKTSKKAETHWKIIKRKVF